METPFTKQRKLLILPNDKYFFLNYIFMIFQQSFIFTGNKPIDYFLFEENL